MNQRFPGHRRMLAAAAAAVLCVVIAVAATVAVGTSASGASTTGAAAGAAPLAAKPRPKPTRTTSAATSTTTPVSSAPSSAPGAVGSTAASTGAPVSSPCVDGTGPVLFGGQPYRIGYVIGVKTGAYGTGARVVLRSVNVVQIAGTTATVEGGPTCLSPSSCCGATIPTVTAYFTGLPTVPAYGDVIDLYGTTGTNTLSAAGYVVKGHCDPDFGC